MFRRTLTTALRTAVAAASSANTTTQALVNSAVPLVSVRTRFSDVGLPPKPKAARFDNRQKLVFPETPNFQGMTIPLKQPSKTKMSVSKVYANVNANQPREYWDYENAELVYGEQDSYEAISKLGTGKYSEVFAGVNSITNQPVVLKVLKPARKNRIRREVKVLQLLRGGPNIAQFVEIVRDPEWQVNTIVTEYAPGQDYKKVFPTLSADDIKYYMYEVLRGLDYAHSHGIMHRDIKPGNLVIDTQSRSVRIIDWGLAEFYHPYTEYNVRVATRHFKAPELLLDMTDYDYSVDMWSFGCVLAGLIFRLHPVFKGPSVDLLRIAEIFGSEPIHAYMKKYSLKFNSSYDGIFSADTHIEGKGLQSLINDSNRDLATAEALDLLSKLLVIDHQERLTAKQAMAHPYFAGVHKQ